MRSIKSILLLALTGAAALAHAENAADWFERMRSAVHTEDYEGRFVYQVGPQLEAMYVVHRVSGDMELERLVSLNGDKKQVIRGDRAVACLEPGKHAISVLEGVGGAALSAKPSMTQLQALYDFELQDEQRAAGRDALMIKVFPKDKLRFGYEITVDAQTALPLRTLMIDEQGEQQSQMLFVDLKTGPDIPPIERDISALEMTQRDKITVSALVSDPASSGWRFNQLPAGFSLRSYRASPQREHFIFSDGLATLSLYIEAISPGGGFEGESRLGAARAFGTIRHGRQVTAVGEVPGQTLRLIAAAVAPE